MLTTIRSLVRKKWSQYKLAIHLRSVSRISHETNVDFKSPEVEEFRAYFPRPTNLYKPEHQVFFDLETTGLESSSEIVQIGAVTSRDGDNLTFSQYVLPTESMSQEVTSVHGLHYDPASQTLCKNGEPVDALPLKAALTDFLAYLKQFSRPVVVGHNIFTFDIPLLLRCLEHTSQLQDYSDCVAVCLDTYFVCRHIIPKVEVRNYKQSTLVAAFLQEEYDAHDALADSLALQKVYAVRLDDVNVAANLFPFAFTLLRESLEPFVAHKLMTRFIQNRIASSGLGLDHLRLAHRLDAKNGIFRLLSERDACGLPRVEDAYRMSETLKKGL